MKPRWKVYLLYASFIIVGASLLLGLFRIILLGYSVDWTGFGEYPSSNGDVQRGKTLWDWMELLIIPLALAGGAFYLNRSERAVEDKLAENRAQLDREIALDRQQEAALQAYFDRMSDLLLREKLRTTKNTEVRDVARTRTISVMRGLDTKRNNLVIQFLREAKLITDKNSILNDADMGGMNLQSLNLYDVYLQKVDLQDANLQKADLRSAILRGAILWDADLRSTDLRDTDLQGTDLQGADLRKAKVTNEQLDTAKSLQGATMPDGTLHN